MYLERSISVCTNVGISCICGRVLHVTTTNSLVCKLLHVAFYMCICYSKCVHIARSGFWKTCPHMHRGVCAYMQRGHMHNIYTDLSIAIVCTLELYVSMCPKPDPAPPHLCSNRLTPPHLYSKGPTPHPTPPVQ